MPSSFTGSFMSLSKSRDVEDKSATRTGSLAEGYVHPAATGGDEAVTEPGKNSRRLFEMSTVLMLASREKRSVMRRDWRNKRFLQEQTLYNQRAEEDARTAVSTRSERRPSSIDAGLRRQKVVRIQSDRWTEWRDAHQRRQAEVAREQYLESLSKRPKSAPPLDQFLNGSGNNSDTEGRSTTPEPRTTAGPTLTTHVPLQDTRHQTPVLGMLSAIKHEANSFAREPRKHNKPPVSSSAAQEDVQANRIEKAAQIKQQQRQAEKQDAANPVEPEEALVKLTKANRTDSDLLDLYDDAAVSLMSGFSGRLRQPAAKKRPARKPATWDEQDDMALHFLSSMSGARSPSPGPGDSFTRSYSPARQPQVKSMDSSALKKSTSLRIKTDAPASASRHGSNGTVSPVSPETPGKLDVLGGLPSAPNHEPRGSDAVPRISITAE